MNEQNIYVILWIVTRFENFQLVDFIVEATNRRGRQTSLS